MIRCDFVLIMCVVAFFGISPRSLLFFYLFFVFHSVFKSLPLALFKLYDNMVVFTCRTIMAIFNGVERVADTFISWYLYPSGFFESKVVVSID